MNLIVLMSLNRTLRRFILLCSVLILLAGWYYHGLPPHQIIFSNMPAQQVGSFGLLFGVLGVLYYVIASFWAWVGRLARNPS
jgi:hypothetical protein